MSALWSCTRCPLLHEYPDQTVSEVPSSRIILGVTLLILSETRELMGFYLSGACVRLFRAHFPCTSVLAFSSATTKPAPDSPPASKPAFLAHKTLCIPKNTFLIFKQFLTVTCLMRRHEHFQRMIQPTSPPALPNQMTIPPEVPILLHWLKREPKTTTLDLNTWIYEFLNALKQGPNFCPHPLQKKKGRDYFQNFLTRKGYKDEVSFTCFKL